MTFDTHSKIYLDREIEKKVRKAGSSFYWAMRLLDAEKRRAMYAVYAFCREVDDIADVDVDAYSDDSFCTCNSEIRR